jgi:glutathione synthase
MPLRIAFVMDPLERILVDKDTTFVFMLEAQTRGHEIYFVGIDDLFVDGPRPMARCRRAEVRRAARHYSLFEERVERLEWFHIVFMRKDPPFDLAYYFATLMLSLVDPQRSFVLNDPQGLRNANEKLYALHFPELTPETVVSRDPDRLKTFMDSMGGEMIIKPLEHSGGAGVFHVRRADRNLNSLLETMTALGTRLLMAQRYLPEAREGDKRLLVLDGEPLGALLRVPREDETRANIHVGATCERAAVTARDREICRALAPRLRADGLYFVGLDVIGDLVTEINVTSPTGVQEINALDGVHLEAQVIDFVERRAASLGRNRPD